MGGGRTRRCARCAREVLDLSELTHAEVKALLARAALACPGPLPAARREAGLRRLPPEDRAPWRALRIAAAAVVMGASGVVGAVWLSGPAEGPSRSPRLAPASALAQAPLAPRSPPAEAACAGYVRAEDALEGDASGRAAVPDVVERGPSATSRRRAGLMSSSRWASGQGRGAELHAGRATSRTAAQTHSTEAADELEEQIAKLTEAVRELRELLGRNSSKPPSSDPPGAGVKASKKKPKGGHRGGQKGHRGTYRFLVPPERVNAFVDFYPPERECCWERLPETPDPRGP